MHVAIRAGVRDRHGVAQRPARSAAPARRRRRIACRSCMRRRARRSGRSAIARRLDDIRARYGLPRAIRAVCRHDRAAQEPDAADDGVCGSARKAGIPHHLVCVGPVRMVVARSGRAHRAARHSATPCTSPATCRSRICRRSTTSASFSCSRRSTKASACRSSRRWRAASPVLTSNTSSLGEIAGDAAETVDPDDTDALADAIVAAGRPTPSGAAICASAAWQRARASRGRRPRATCSRCISAPPVSTVTRAGAGLPADAGRSARAR